MELFGVSPWPWAGIWKSVLLAAVSDGAGTGAWRIVVWTCRVVVVLPFSLGLILRTLVLFEIGGIAEDLRVTVGEAGPPSVHAIPHTTRDIRSTPCNH